MTDRASARKFHFLREIASGGFGSVYLCKVVHSDGFSRLAAVKLLKAQWTDNEEVVHRIRDEARLLGLLRHRNIVDVMDLTSIDGRTAVVMEYLEAVDFRVVTRQLRDPGQRMPAKAALEAMAAVAGALDAAYNRPPIPGEKPLRVIHRDIKPSNIMIDETGMVKVLDFGVARSEIENRESHTRELQFGSVDYMAPERLFFEPETPASDVYSLAATLYEILALEKLGKARGSPERHATHLADRLSFLRAQIALSGSSAIELEALLRSGLAFEHEGRPTAAAFFQRARALSRLMDGEDLSSWAERTLPQLIQQAQADRPEGSPLTDSVLTEDSLVFGSEGGVPEPGRAEAVQRGALAELGEGNVFSPSPATGAPPRGLDLATDTDDVLDDWEDIPTNVQGATANTAADPAPAVSPQVHFHDPSDPIQEARAALQQEPEPAPEPVLPEAPIPTDEQPTRPYVAGQTIVPDDMWTPPEPELVIAPEPAAVPEPEPEPRPVPIAVASPQPEPAQPPPQKAPQKAGGSRGMMMAAGLVLGCALPMGVVGIAGLVFALDVGGIRSAVMPAGEVVELPDELNDFDAPPPPSESAGPDEAAPEADGGVRFTSMDPRTQKLKVRCGAENSRGEQTAQLSITEAEQCMVTAILESRERLNAVVDGVSEGHYQCFADGEETCTRE